MTKDYSRIIDANLNRLREGIRVIEDIARYLQNDSELSKKLKNLRHSAKISDINSLLESRDSVNDVLRPTMELELERSDIKSILIANYKRAEEAARVLEEILKIDSPRESEIFKNIRYELYTMEKNQILAIKI